MCDSLIMCIYLWRCQICIHTCGNRVELLKMFVHQKNELNTLAAINEGG
ncbi:hypothetical protein GBAR_LOCUS9131, partial [Geodia barretti]